MFRCRQGRARAYHYFCLVVFVALEACGGAKCPDGSDGLTKALYEAGVPAAYKNVTCIPVNEFSYYEGNVKIEDGLKFLTSIEMGAFYHFKGTLTFKGSFPLLALIGVRAFDHAGNSSSQKINPFNLDQIIFGNCRNGCIGCSNRTHQMTNLSDTFCSDSYRQCEGGFYTRPDNNRCVHCQCDGYFCENSLQCRSGHCKENQRCSSSVTTTVTTTSTNTPATTTVTTTSTNTPAARPVKVSADAPQENVESTTAPTTTGPAAKFNPNNASSSTTDADNQGETNSSTSTPPNAGFIGGVAIGTVCLLGVVVALIFLRLKNTANKDEVALRARMANNMHALDEQVHVNRIFDDANNADVDGNAGGGAPTPSIVYTEPVTHNEDYTYAPMPPPTERHGANADEPEYAMPQDDYAPLKGGNTTYSSPA